MYEAVSVAEGIAAFRRVYGITKCLQVLPFVP